jgi:hypothetical protein
MQRGAVSASGVFAIACVALIVALVSLPQLRALGVRENEADARRTLEILAGALARAPQLPDLAQLAAQPPNAARELADLEVLPDGRLRRHGYLFDLIALPDGTRVLRAWPWQTGRTGAHAFAHLAGHGLLEVQAAAPGGLDAPPSPQALGLCGLGAIHAN